MINSNAENTHTREDVTFFAKIVANLEDSFAVTWIRHHFCENINIDSLFPIMGYRHQPQTPDASLLLLPNLRPCFFRPPIKYQI